jgi:CarboxypepD_reg-like domain
MKKIFLFIIIIFIANIAVAGNGNNNKDKDNVKLIFGKVIDKKSGEEIAGAEIKINDKIVYTDLNGNFSASIIPAKIEAVVTYLSYNETKVNIDPFSYNTIVVELESK